MKKRITFIILLYILINVNINAQVEEPTYEQKMAYIQILSGPVSDDQFYTLYAVIENNIKEAKDVIEQNFWIYSRYDQTIALKALLKLHSDLTLEYAHRLIDTLDNNPYDYNFYGGDSAPDILSEKVQISSVLFELNDFTKTDFVFELIERDSVQKVWGIVIEPLLKVIQNVPTRSEEAKEKLIDLVYYSNDETTRLNALIALDKAFGVEVLPIILESFQSEISDANRYFIINQYFSKYNSNFNLEKTLRESLYSEPSSSIRLHMAKILLYGLGGIPNYNFVKNYINDEQDETIKDLIDFEVKHNIPRLFDEESTLDVIIDTVISVTDQAFKQNWLSDLKFKNDLQSIMQSAKINLLAGDSLTCRVQIKEFQDSVDFVYKDSLNTDPRFVTIEGWKFLYWNAQYILDRLPEPQTNPYLLVNLNNSQGNQIPASNVMYYEGSWKDAVNNGDGTFTVITTKPTVSIRMFYEYANQTVNNVPAQNNTYTFTTVNAAVQLKNSSGNLIDEGTVQYYAGAWRSFGTTANGVAYKELLPVNYSFRMTYEGGNQDKQQNLSDNQIVVFQTVNAAVQLKNSSGNLIDEGTVQYYAGAWRSLGTTANGVAHKELLPVNYSFRMTYEYVSNDKQQNLSGNPVVDFNTVLCTIKVTNANNQPLEGANTKYYSLAWRDIGLTNSNGEITKELLPKTLSFRATYNNVSRDKQQDISVNNLVEIMLNIP